VSPSDGFDGCGKFRPGFDPRTIQPVTSRYTDYTIPAHFQVPGSSLFSSGCLRPISPLPVPSAFAYINIYIYIYKLMYYGYLRI
jgi:hypothetical protein